MSSGTSNFDKKSWDARFDNGNRKMTTNLLPLRKLAESWPHSTQDGPDGPEHCPICNRCQLGAALDAAARELDKKAEIMMLAYTRIVLPLEWVKRHIVGERGGG